MQTQSARGRGILSPGEVGQFETHGYIIRRGMLSPQEVAEIRESFMAVAADGPVEGLSETHRSGKAYDPKDPLARYPRIMNPHRREDLAVGRIAKKYLLDKRFEAVLQNLFGEEPIAAQSMFYFKPPGARGQDFHQDNFYLKVRPGTCMAAWIAIDDCDEENGTMMVVPGTQGMEIVCPERSDAAKFFTTEHVPIPEGRTPLTTHLKAGDVLFFKGSIIHGSYPNTSSSRFRRSLILHYVPAGCIEVSGWYKPLLRFSGEVVEKELATGGGPCGTLQEAKGPH